MSTRTSCIQLISSKDLKTNRASTAASGPHSLECAPRTVTTRYRDLMFCVVYEDDGGLRIIGEIQIQDHGLHSLKLKVSAPASCGPAVWPLALSFAFSLNLPPSPPSPPTPHYPPPLSHARSHYPVRCLGAADMQITASGCWLRFQGSKIVQNLMFSLP